MTHRNIQYVDSVDGTHFFIGVQARADQFILSMDKEDGVRVYVLGDDAMVLDEQVAAGELCFSLQFNDGHHESPMLYCSITPNEPGIDILDVLLV